MTNGDPALERETTTQASSSSAMWDRRDAFIREQVRREDLEGGYRWADGLAVTAGLEDRKAALLGLSGPLTHGHTVGRAVARGQREAQESWGAVRRALRARGLQPWRGTMAADHLGRRAALAAQQPTAAAPRGWNHRRPTGRDAMPTPQQAQARTLCWAMPDAESPAACEARRDPCGTRYGPLAPKAVERLGHAWERLGPCSQFPREPWRHRRTTPGVASRLAAVRRRTPAAKRLQKVAGATAIIGPSRPVAAQTCRRLKAPEVLPAVYAGAK